MPVHDANPLHAVSEHVVPALTVLATMGLVGWVLAWWQDRPAIANRLLVVLVVGSVSFQVAHFFEHLLQIGHWFAHPGESPWITSWGQVATDGLSALAGHPGAKVTGTELLHLTGNWITFTGLIALYITLRSRHTEARQMRATKVAFWVQLVHVIEHISLTSSWFLLGRQIGLSTLLGASFYLDDFWATSAWSASIRTWWHFIANLVVTVAALYALQELRRVWPLRTDAPEVSASAALQQGPIDSGATEIH